MPLEQTRLLGEVLSQRRTSGNQLRHSASRREYILLRIITADGRPHNPYRLRVFDCCSRVHWIAAIFTP